MTKDALTFEEIRAAAIDFAELAATLRIQGRCPFCGTDDEVHGYIGDDVECPGEVATAFLARIRGGEVQA